MAVQTVSTSTNVDSIASGAWRSNDTLTITNGAVVTVNTDQAKFWSGITITNGKLRIENNSTTTAIRFLTGRSSGNSAQSITPGSGLGSIEIAGNWIQIGVGDGTAGQEFNIPYYDYAPMVEVETAPSSGVYEMWTNCLGAYWPTPVSAMSGLNGYGSGRRGMVFEQLPIADPDLLLTLTNSTTTNTSRVITVSSTANIFPGATVSGGNIPANSVVEAVLSGTQFEINAAATGSSSTVTLTIYPPFTAQLQNRIKFGNGSRGAVVPNGCKIRIPNILLTSVYGTNLNASSQWTGMVINLTNGGSMTADKCLFDNVTNTFTTPQTLILRNVGFALAQSISRAYGVIIDGYAVSNHPIRRYINSSFTTTFTGNYQFQGNYADWQYITGTINNVVLQGGRSTYTGVATGSGGMLLSYAEEVQLSNLRAVFPRGFDNTYSTALALLYANRCVINNIESYGVPPLRLYGSSENIIDGIVYNSSAYGNKYVSSWSAVSNATVRAGMDPVVDGIMTPDTPYYLKMRFFTTIFMDDCYEARPQAFVPHLSTQGFSYLECFALNSSVRLSWTQNLPIHNSPAYEIYRSTTAGVPVRDAGTRIYTTNTTTTITYTDATAVNGTRYYYVLRKYTSAGVYTDSPVMEATPTANPAAPTNLLLRSTDLSNAQWVKTNCSASTTVNAPSPFTSPLNQGNTTRRVTVSGANATAVNTVTGLSIGQQYRASVWVCLQKSTSDVTTTGMRLTFGTEFLDITVTRTWTRYSVTFTATATSHDFTLRFNTNGVEVLVGNCQVTAGATLWPDLYSGSGTVTAAYDPTNLYARCANRSGGASRHNGISWAVPTVFGGFVEYEAYTSSTYDFTPSRDNLTLRTAQNGGALITISTNSSRNAIKNFASLGGGIGGTLLASFAASCSDNELRAFTVDLGLSAGATSALSLISILTDSNRNKLADFDLLNFPSYTLGRLFNMDNTANGTIIENIRCDNNDHALAGVNNDTAIKGLSGGAASVADGANTYWAMGSATDGIFVSQTGVYDSIFAEMYHSATTGALNLLFNASTDITPPYTTNSSTVQFSNTGALYLQTAGDSITYTWPHLIRGVTGFRNIDLKCYATDFGSSNAAFDVLESLLLEFQVDTGSGWSAWAEATPANLSAVAGINATTGFGLKLRLTARPFFKYTSQTNNFVIGETVRASSGGGTGVVVADFDNGTSGTVVLSNVTGTWNAGSAVVRDSDSQARATISNTNGFALGPSFTSRINGLQIYTNIDLTKKYPTSISTINLTNVISGSSYHIERVIDNVRLEYGTVSGTTKTIFLETSPTSSNNDLRIRIRKGSSAPYYKTWETLITIDGTEQNIYVSQIPD